MCSFVIQADILNYCGAVDCPSFMADEFATDEAFIVELSGIEAVYNLDNS